MIDGIPNRPLYFYQKDIREPEENCFLTQKKDEKDGFDGI